MTLHRLTVLVLFNCNVVTADVADDSLSAFDTSYKCEGRISSGLDKENGTVSHARFQPNEEFFVTHTSNFPAEVVDAYLRKWDASEEQLKDDYQSKTELVSYVLFDEEELDYGDGYRMETGSYWLRQASDKPTSVFSWKKCKAYSFLQNTRTRITCDVGHNKLFEMNATSGEFTYAYLGSMHDAVGQGGYGGDSAVVEHGRCRPYYP